MKKYLPLLIVISVFFTVYQANSQCRTDEYLQYLIQKEPQIQQILNSHQQKKAKGTSLQQTLADDGRTVTIPVVVHVLYHPLVSDANVSREAILGQIAALNAAYSGRINQEKVSTVNTNIQFCLAATDPNGNATTGVTRTQVEEMNFRAFDDDDKIKRTKWDQKRYLNIWVCALVSRGGGIFLAYSSYPVVGASIISQQNDGVVINYRVFGVYKTPPGFMGREALEGETAVHEVGHYLGLWHPWKGGCGDEVDDTEPMEDYDSTGNYDKNNCMVMSCATPTTPARAIPANNYMNWMPDWCINSFTAGQSTRMREMLQTYRLEMWQAGSLTSKCPLGIVKINGADMVCPNDIQTYTTNFLDFGCTYQWIVRGGVFPDHHNMTTAQVVDPANFVRVKWDAVAPAGGAYITISPWQFTCKVPGLPVETIHRVQILSISKPTLAAITSLECGTKTFTLSTSATNTDEYLWTLPAGFSFAPGTNPTAATVTISTGGNTEGSISVKAINTRCKISSEVVSTVIRRFARPLSLNPGKAFCRKDSTRHFKVSGSTPVLTYRWILPPNMTIVGSNSNNSEIEVKLTDDTYGDYNVEVKAVTECGELVGASALIRVWGDTPITLNGFIQEAETRICDQIDVTYVYYGTVSSVNTTGRYEWIVSGPVDIVRASGTTLKVLIRGDGGMVGIRFVNECNRSEYMMVPAYQQAPCEGERDCREVYTGNFPVFTVDAPDSYFHQTTSSDDLVLASAEIENNRYAPGSSIPFSAVAVFQGNQPEKTSVQWQAWLSRDGISRDIGVFVWVCLDGAGREGSQVTGTMTLLADVPEGDYKLLLSAAMPDGKEVRLDNNALAIPVHIVSSAAQPATVQDKNARIEAPAGRSRVELQQNVPNPSDEYTTITYSLPEATTVSLALHNIMGVEVLRLLNAEARSVGIHEVKFDTHSLPPGVYFYTLLAGNRTFTKKMVVQ